MSWVWLLWVLGWIAAADCLRRPHLQWVAADREKSFWVAMLIIGGPVTLWIYVVGVLPKLAAASRTGAGHKEFLKKLGQ